MREAVIGSIEPLDYAGQEALNTICTNLTFAGRNLRKIIFTSNLQSEGKSWMTMHIAMNMAQRGRRVVVVDADLRRSFIMQRYQVRIQGNVTGLAHYLSGQCEMDDIVYETDRYGMCIIPAGRDVSNPMSLMDTPYFGQMLDELARHFDLVIVDAPPVGMVIDAAEIAACCDGTVLVLEYNSTRLRDVAMCKRQMEQSGTPVVGCIINKVKYDSLSAKKYYSRSYYNHYLQEYQRGGDGRK